MRVPLLRLLPQREFSRVGRFALCLFGVTAAVTSPLLHRSPGRISLETSLVTSQMETTFSVATKLETSPMETGLTGYQVATAEVATGDLPREIGHLAAYRDAYQCDARRQPAHGVQPCP